MENNNKLINIEAIIKNKNPKLYKKLPSFAIRRLEKIICQDKINRLLTLYGHLDGVEFIDAVFQDFNVEILCHGLENVNLNTKMLFAANHPLGAIDGLAVISTVNKQFGKSKAIVNDLLLNIESLKSVFCGVNVYGHNTSEISNNVKDFMNSNEHICIFPAGMCSRKIDGKIQDLPWKPSFINRAVKNHIPIVPVYVDAQNNNSFYNIANIRVKLGIKFNYELILLPSEVFKYHDKPINLYFGKPLTHDELITHGTPTEITKYVRELTYKLKKN